MTLAVVGIIATASAGVLSISLTAHEQGSSRAELQREGLVAMERMTSGLRRSTHLLIPNQHSPARRILAFSGLVNDDGDAYFDDPLFPRYDEDFAYDMGEDGANGIPGVDDDGDGQVDERSGQVFLTSDEFKAISFKGDDGNWPWASNWSELIGGDGGAADGVVSVAAGPGLATYALRIGGKGALLDGSLLTRALATGSPDSILLSFRCARSGAPGGSVTLSIMKSGGAWSDLATYDVGGVGSPRVEVFDIQAFTSGKTAIRFSGSGTTGAGGYIYFDDIRVRAVEPGTGSTSADDDEDGEVDEDPIDGIDNDLDGNIDEDAGGDSSADGAPGVLGIDDDGDGLVDEGSSMDDDEDGSLAELGLRPVIYTLHGATNTLRELDKHSGVTVEIADHVTNFAVEYESPTRVTLLLELTGDDGHVLSLSETVCLRNPTQRAGKRVR